MNGLIFKIFGVAILMFEVMLVLAFCGSISRLELRNGEFIQGFAIFSGFLLISTLIAVGLIRLQRWAAITASIVGLVWSLIIAAGLGYLPLKALLFGAPVVFGLLTPLFATIRGWSTLKSVDNKALSPFFRALRSLDPLHLE